MRNPVTRGPAAAVVAALTLAGVGLVHPPATGAARAARPSATALANACAAPGWVLVEGIPIAVSSLATTTEFEFIFGAAVRPGTAHLFRGEVGDASWLNVAGMATRRLTDVAVGPGVDPPIWVAEFDGGVHTSTTGGADFQQSAGLAGRRITALLPITSTVLAASSDPNTLGVYGWDAASNTWFRRGADSIATQIFFDLERDEADNLWLATDGQGLWRSGDGGSGWGPVAVNGTTNSTILDIEVDAAAPGRIYIGHAPVQRGIGAGATVTGLHVTGDGGASWRQALAPEMMVTGIAALSLAPGSAYAAAWGRGIFFTADGGVSWRPIAGPASGTYPEAAKWIDTLVAARPRGIPADCELLLAGGEGGIWARNVANVTHTAVYLPMATKNCRVPCAPTTDGAPPAGNWAVEPASDRLPARLQYFSGRVASSGS